MARIDSLRTEKRFKKTEIGEIPVDWGAMRLSEIGEIITGSTPSTKNRDYYNGKYMFVTPFDMGNFKYVTKTAIMLSEAGMSVSKPFPRNTVMVTCIASIGKIAMASAKCCTNQQINSIICNKKTDPHFVYYTMQTKINTLKALAGQTAVPIVKKSLFSSVPIPLPSLPEQKKIAEILSTVDQAIEKSNEIIEKTKELKKGLMQELLTKGIGHKEFTDTEIGRMPKEWEIVRVQDISLDLIGGGTPSTSNPDYWNGELAWMTSAHINEREVKTGQRYITKEGLHNSSTSIVPEGNLLVATRVGIGKAAINKIDIAISQDLMGVIINNNRSIPNFVYWYLMNNKNKLKSIAQGSTIKGILKEGLGNLKLPLPSLFEQKKIVQILGSVDEQIEKEIKHKESLEILKKGLMQVLLTGKTRVKV